MIRNIVFDFGAVLVDWNRRYLFGPYFNDDSKCDWFLDNVLTFDRIRKSDGGMPVDDFCKELIAGYPEWEDAIWQFKTNWIKQMSDIPVPGMLELVRNLKKAGYHVFGLTNWGADFFPLVEFKYPVFSELEGYVVSGRVKMLKPEARIYNELTSRYDLKPEECLFIDDSQPNVDGAIAVGWKAIRFENCDQTVAELKKIGIEI